MKRSDNGRQDTSHRVISDSVKNKGIVLPAYYSDIYLQTNSWDRSNSKRLKLFCFRFDMHNDIYISPDEFGWDCTQKLNHGQGHGKSFNRETSCHLTLKHAETNEIRISKLQCIPSENEI